jgi:hypothetical protein
MRELADVSAEPDEVFDLYGPARSRPQTTAEITTPIASPRSCRAPGYAPE